MRYNTDLFELIKVLSKSEKRYFKIYAAQHTKKECNNYILLFDAIARQDKYNEEKLRYKFRNYTFSKNIAKTKYLLYELIIKMLRQIHNGKSIESKIAGILESADHLYGKSLYGQAYTCIRKAKKLAGFFEHYQFWFQALQLESKLAGKLHKTNVDHDRQAFIEELAEVKSFVGLEMDYQLLFYKMQSYVDRFRQNADSSTDFDIEEIMTSELISSGGTGAVTFLSKVYYLEIVILYALSVQDYDAAFDNLERMYALWNENLEKSEMYSEQYTRFCINYMSCCTNAKKKGRHYDELLLSLQVLGKVNSRNSDRNFFLASVYDFIFNLTIGSLEVCTVQLFTLKDMLKEQGELLDQYSLINLYYHVSVYYFLRGEFNETLNWIDKIQASDGKNQFLNVQNYCRLLSLMAKYCENEFEVLEYDILKTHRFLSNGKPIKPIEKLILSFVRQLLNVKHAREETTVFAEFYTALHGYYGKEIYPLAKLTAGNAIYQWVRNRLPNEDRTLLN